MKKRNNNKTFQRKQRDEIYAYIHFIDCNKGLEFCLSLYPRNTHFVALEDNLLRSCGGSNTKQMHPKTQSQE